MSENKKFPVTLESVIFTKLSFETMMGFNPDPSTFEMALPVNSVDIDHIPNRKNTIAVQMMTKINTERSNDQPYVVDVVCVALFNYEDDAPIEEVRKAASITGHNVCYGAIRESVSWITSRLPFGPINLGLSILRPQKQSEPEQK